MNFNAWSPLASLRENTSKDHLSTSCRTEQGESAISSHTYATTNLPTFESSGSPRLRLSSPRLYRTLSSHLGWCYKNIYCLKKYQRTLLSRRSIDRHHVNTLPRWRNGEIPNSSKGCCKHTLRTCMGWEHTCLPHWCSSRLLPSSLSAVTLSSNPVGHISRHSPTR